MENKGGRPRKFETPEEMQEAIDKYFKECEEKNKAKTIEGLAVALEVDRKTLLNYEKQEEYNEFFHTVKKAKNQVLSNLMENAISGKGVASITIFNLKNNFGYTDKVEHSIDSEKNTIKVKFGE